MVVIFKYNLWSLCSYEQHLYSFNYRDELCRNGDVLSSPALSFTVKDLTAMVDAVRQEKLPKEQPEEEVEVKDKDSPAVSAGST